MTMVHVGKQRRAYLSTAPTTKVTFMFTRYSVILPPEMTTFCSLIQAPLTWSMVSAARLTPVRMASSKLLVIFQLLWRR